MVKKATVSAHGETSSVKSGKTPRQPSSGTPKETLDPGFSKEQCQTILKYAKYLPAHLSERLTAKGARAKASSFTLDELDELLDHVEDAIYPAKGNERQKVQRIAERVSKLLGSTIDTDELHHKGLRKKAGTVYQIKVTLTGIYPLIWRRIQTKDCTLDELHGLIQVAMGWEFEHPYNFRIGGIEFVDQEMTSDNDEVRDSYKTLLSNVIPEPNRRPRFQYEYDFGDSWMHQLIVEERFEPEKGAEYPVCVAGERACPPEDCGGPYGYADLVEAMSDSKHPRREEFFEWVGEEFNPERFDLKAINKELRPKRRRKT